jgi:hypothetical protein
MVVFVLAASLTCILWSITKQSSWDSRIALTLAEFRDHMKQLADAWNKGDARVAADLFAQDALYSSPPDSRIREGRQGLFEWFGMPMGARNQCE